MDSRELIKKVEWKDLKSLSKKEMLIENNISLPWLFTSLFLAYKGYYWAAIPFSGFYFLTALRQVHNGFHNALGTGKFLTWLSMYLNSISMITSIHAVKFNHIRHHKFCLGEEDYEGKSASMKWYEAILYGPKHLFLVHWITFKKANDNYRKKMIFELTSILIFVCITFYFQINFLIYHILIMFFGEFLMAFFAVWTVHHDTHEHPDIARTQRGFWKNKLTFSMFYHMEHHLFPAVPTIKLPELAKRIDEILPELNKNKLFKMSTIYLDTNIKSDLQTVFDLARDIDLHQKSTFKTGEKAIAGRTSGLIEEGETVTWKAKHLGIYQTLTTKIVAMNNPHHFTDIMQKGAFKSMKHQHIFRQEGKNTIMTDIFEFHSPFGIIGKIFDALFLKNYMKNFLLERNKLIKTVAENKQKRERSERQNV